MLTHSKLHHRRVPCSADSWVWWLSMQHEIDKSVALICRGHSFFSTNAELLDRYAACPTSAEVIQVQTDYLDQLARVPARIPGKYCTLSRISIACQYCIVHCFPAWQSASGVFITAEISCPCHVCFLLNFGLCSVYTEVVVCAWPAVMFVSVSKARDGVLSGAYRCRGQQC